MSADDDEPVARRFDHRLLGRLLGYLRPYRWRVGLAIVLVLADTVAQLVGPYLTLLAIDQGIRHRDLEFLDRVALLYFAVLLAGFVLAYLHTRLLHGIGQRVMMDLRLALFGRLQRLPVSYFQRHAAGRTVTRVTGDVDVLNDLFTAGVVAVFGDLLILVGILVAMTRLNVELLAVASSVLPLIVLVTLTFRARARRWFRDVRRSLARLSAFVHETVEGMTTVQIHNREASRLAAFAEINGEHRDAHLRTVRDQALLFPLLELVGALAVALIVWYGGRQVMWTGITLGTLVAFLQYTQRFFRPVSDLSEKFNLLQQAMASAERIFALLDAPADPAQVAALDRPAGRGRRPGGDGAIEFDRVSFAYSGDDWVVRDVSFAVRTGERIALVGVSGAGKTTLAALLLAFHRPQSGAIRVGGRDLRDWDVHELRRFIGYVPQDGFLFSGTIADNLRLGDPRLGEPALERAARETGAHDFITRRPGGYAAAVHERGATLSAGEKQLLACARALAADPGLLLLDEATSSVDPQTEALLHAALRRLMRQRTSLIIAHRLATLRDADRIVVLHHGQVRETGSHEELTAQRGIYFRLCQFHSLAAGAGAGAPPADEPVVDTRGGLP